MTKPRKGVKPKSPSHVKGWETRRLNNPLRWGQQAIIKRHEILDEIDKSFKQEFQDVSEAAANTKKGKKYLDRRNNILRFGESDPPKWKKNLFKAMDAFIEVRDANEDSETIKKAYHKMLRLKINARKTLLPSDFEDFMALIGSELNLSRHGKFSIQSFIDSP
jgi:hypothetical protein